MFDVSFTELMVIGVIALIVIGPERLPKVARTVGHLLGRAQRYVNDVKGDIQREIELDELRKFKSDIDDAASSMKSSLRDTENSLRSGLDEASAGLSDLKKTVEAPADSAQKPDPDATDAAAPGDTPAVAAEPAVAEPAVAAPPSAQPAPARPSAQPSPVDAPPTADTSAADTSAANVPAANVPAAETPEPTPAPQPKTPITP